jgi:hypothetical protein
MCACALLSNGLPSTGTASIVSACTTSALKRRINCRRASDKRLSPPRSAMIAQMTSR